MNKDELLVLVRKYLSEKNYAQFDEYVEVGEEELAIEYALTVFVEEGKKISGELLDEIAKQKNPHTQKDIDYLR